MKLLLLPLVTASASLPDIETSALLQTTKQQKAALEERATSEGGLSGLEGAIAGKKKKEPDNVCDDEQAKKLIDCFNFAHLSLSKVLEGGNVAQESVVEVANIFGGNGPVRTHLDRKQIKENSCTKLHEDMKCMQSNPCWRKDLNELPHDTIKAACDEKNKDADVYPGVKFDAMCQMTPLSICESITNESHISGYLNGCKAIKGDVEVKCAANLETYAPSTTVLERCDDGFRVVGSAEECRKAANLMASRYITLTKRFKRRPAGCYKKKDTVYWNERVSKADSDRCAPSVKFFCVGNRRKRSKNRVTICKPV